MPNMPFMPSLDDFLSPATADFGCGFGPRRQATASSKFNTAVAFALIPIFFSIEPVDTPLRAPILPSSDTTNFGTMKKFTVDRSSCTLPFSSGILAITM